ncbi:pantetheine-phosphate adenylyltransferase [Alicyclobacillus tolerans]|uniref:pantetheine-phosphate adenylyltransferase n=1 Tax=Alicyclobacillus tolerans TaxID=90970 RepID=UPI0027E09E92|nr:pantetheine-phosphate adenylyltransferase [Alicyclobacillus tolerans]MCF8564405.1 pantetheine-phosphate adenylyltransferase [Alicyclobacillus tolerans]
MEIAGNSKKIAVYPGSFDPITNGHMDILKRAAALFDQVIVAVLHNPNKNPLFSVEERMNLISEATKDYDNVAVDSFMGLLVEYVSMKSASAIIRGLREISDFENELRMAHMNRHLNSSCVTVFIPTNNAYSYLSSSLVKEVASHGRDVTEFVPSAVAKAMHEKYRKA